MLGQLAEGCIWLLFLRNRAVRLIGGLLVEPQAALLLLVPARGSARDCWNCGLKKIIGLKLAGRSRRPALVLLLLGAPTVNNIVYALAVVVDIRANSVIELGVTGLIPLNGQVILIFDQLRLCWDGGFCPLLIIVSHLLLLMNVHCKIYIGLFLIAGGGNNCLSYFIGDKVCLLWLGIPVDGCLELALF